MYVENMQSQMRKGILEYCVLLLLRTKERYPSEIIVLLKDAELIVVEGTLYPLLTRLKNEGLLNYRWEESQSGPPRKYYSLTEKGGEFLEGLRFTWRTLETTVTKLEKIEL
jgi:PadR family transcriptional regulator, regulatory protein PadR